jgi:peptide-methionine (R)-S-oxide reductase
MEIPGNRPGTKKVNLSMIQIIAPAIRVLALFCLLAAPAVAAETPATQPSQDAPPPERNPDMPEKIVKSDAEWRKQLTPAQYHVLREKGTDPAFTGKLYRLKDEGIYRCAGCGLDLFDSQTKYESGSGWPSFYQPIKPTVVEAHTDTSHGMVRTEIVCARCGGHLGHVFDDGPEPTGLRYCINSSALRFVKKEELNRSDEAAAKP